MNYTSEQIMGIKAKAEQRINAREAQHAIDVIKEVEVIGALVAVLLILVSVLA